MQLHWCLRHNLQKQELAYQAKPNFILRILTSGKGRGVKETLLKSLSTSLSYLILVPLSFHNGLVTIWPFGLMGLHKSICSGDVWRVQWKKNAIQPWLEVPGPSYFSSRTFWQGQFFWHQDLTAFTTGIRKPSRKPNLWQGEFMERWSVSLSPAVTPQRFSNASVWAVHFVSRICVGFMLTSDRLFCSVKWES